MTQQTGPQKPVPKIFDGGLNTHVELVKISQPEGKLTGTFPGNPEDLELINVRRATVVFNPVNHSLITL